jgi:hypothetical protein
MATVLRGYTFGASEQVTNAKLHTLVDSATVSDIVNADISATADISFSKLAEESIDGSKLTGLANIVSGAGKIPVANIDTGVAANKIVKLDSSANLPAMNGSALTSLNGSNISSGTISTARLGSGTPSSSNFLRGDQTWSVPFTSYDSDWFAVTTGTNYSKTHNLNTTKLIIDIFYADDGSGTNMMKVGTTDVRQDGGANMSGCSIESITTTTLSVHTGAYGIAGTLTAGAFGNKTSGYYRIIVLALP